MVSHSDEVNRFADVPKDWTDELSSQHNIMWSWKLDDVKRNGMSTRQWARYHLMRLHLGEDLTHIMRGGNRYPIAPGDEIMELLPEVKAAH